MDGAFIQYVIHALSRLCRIAYFLLALPGDLARRNHKTGSRFIQELVHTFVEFACQEHFLDLLVKVCLSRCLLSFDAIW